ncbi:DUF1697 domain-containing protein [Aeromicrobium ginsengisoli]|uniref:DUF1697 domain-containing protein n=1 Tax=Aeromicrobium ginsengisoli TaxID=363867 RepID=A0A5M4F9E0_9ACTN|nr:DUF1697 domain-containing protein [Aeromicrobium ginsengisoli]KAA1394327.1 DUF1697 domain-containing protein [Aeromicrobium ginsengisoli]
MTYVVLFRGINVGGRNKVPMAALRDHLGADFANVRTYIQSGNVLLDSDRSTAEVTAHIDAGLRSAFTLDSDLVRVLVLDADAFREVVAEAPDGFGGDPDTHRHDVFFYMGVTAAEVEPHVVVNPDVDEVFVGRRALYHRRVTALATRSRVNKIIGSPVYAGMTIRNWNTTTKLAAMLDE